MCVEKLHKKSRQESNSQGVVYTLSTQRLGRCWVSIERNFLLWAWCNMVMSSSCPWLSSGGTHKNILICTLSPCQKPDLAATDSTKPDSDWPEESEKPHSCFQKFLWLLFRFSKIQVLLLLFILFRVLLTCSCYLPGLPRSYLIFLEELITGNVLQFQVLLVGFSNDSNIKAGH